MNVQSILGVKGTNNGHIANCIAACDYLYTTGTSEGLAVYDIRDLDALRFVKTIELPGQGFTHRTGDVVTVASPRLGRLVNRVRPTDECEPWTFGTAALMRNLARHNADDLAAVAAAQNTRPRKTLGWKTPAEVLDEHLATATA